MKRSHIFFVALLLVLGLVCSFYRGRNSFQHGPNMLHMVWSNKPDTLSSHNVLSSLSTIDKKYFSIDCGKGKCMNPNIIPHPQIEDTWIVVAQLYQMSETFVEVACSAKFDSGVLRCLGDAVPLPIAPTTGDQCSGDLEYAALASGPHDARVFYGPTVPYTIFGSNSKIICLGQWIQDFRTLIEWGFDHVSDEDAIQTTELQRPPPWNAIEKNWFMFFDLHDEAYLHFDVFPQRAFAKLELNGIAGRDLAPFSRHQDTQCMSKFMPKPVGQLESIHQATNSLSITMCSRDDALCIPDASNTFIFIIFQHKTYYNFHALYEPYVMVIDQTEPFQLHAISKRPFWICGRKGFERRLQALQEDPLSEEQEMLYITSISWRDHGSKYHGYIDDVIFIAFGIEDERAGAIDVVAGDLLRSEDLEIC